MKRLPLLALVTLACNPRYADITLTRGNQKDPRVTVTADEIVIPAGLATVVQAELHSKGVIEYERGEHDLTLRSDDETIVIAESTDIPWEFVLIAVGVGDTCVSAVVADEPHDCISVRVIPQE